MDNHQARDAGVFSFDAIRQEAMAFAGIGLYCYRFDGSIVFLDAGTMRIFGLERRFPRPESVSGKNIADLVEYLDEPGYMREEIRRSGRIQGRDWHFKTLDGVEKWVVENSYLARDPESGEEIIQVITQDITRRKQAEDELRRSEALYRATLDNMSDAIHLVDTEFRIELINQTFLDWNRQLGLSTEVVGKSIFEVFPFLDTHIRDEYRHVTASGEMMSSEEQTETGGRIFITDTKKIPVIEEGRVTRILTVIRDISKNKEAESRLRESEERYRSILESIEEGYYEVDLNGSFTFVNPSLCNIFGYTEAEMLGLNYHAYYANAEIIARVEKTFRHVYETGVAVQLFDWPVTLKGGQPAIFEVSVSLLYDRQGNRCGFRGLVRDVTERKKAENALREAEARYRELFENANDIVYTHDLQGRITSFNKAGERVSGYARQEILHRDALEMVAPEYREQASKMLRLKLSGEDVTRYELAILAKDGRVVPFEVSTRLIYKDGQPVEVQGIGRDISERRQAEQERARLEAQIQHTQKLEGLGVLAGGIAHDFNNLLVGILGNAGLAMTRLSEDSPARTYVERIESTAQRAAELTSQMLAYSGKGAIVLRPIDLSSVAEEMGQLLSASISKKAMLHYVCRRDIPLIKGDVAQIHQVLLNLITNASDALCDEEGVITIRTGVVDADRAYLSKTYLANDLPQGRYVYLEVSDTGCGMDTETQTRIFDPFFSTKFAGRGLGLAAVLGIVRGHRGALILQSCPGGGTTIRVLLPAVEAAFSLQSAVETPEEEADPHQWRGSGTVLIADDEPMVRAVTEESLTDRGFEVLTAVNGQDAVEKFAAYSERIRLVLLDLTMPVMGGEEALQRIRRADPAMAIILLSGYTEQDAETRFADGRPSAFIQKPYLPSELIEVVRRVLEGGNKERM